MPDSKQDGTTSGETVIPVIDLSNTDESAVLQQLAAACAKTGSFQVINHGVSDSVISDYQHQHLSFFNLPHFPSKALLYRFAGNSRGYLDHDFTKQRRDWKECLDIGMPGSRDWSLKDDDICNSCLDGYNYFPNERELPGFRSASIKYFEAMEDLAQRIAVLMIKSLGLETSVTDGMDGTENDLLSMLKEEHSSALRMNHYPPRCENMDAEEAATKGGEKLEYFGFHPHTDSGWLTILLQDPECLTHQVFRPGSDEKWVTVRPAPQSFTILTGDMFMLWSNKSFISAWPRVLTDPVKHRYSTQFCYNPGYKTMITPCKPLVDADGAKYVSCAYGYFRAVKAAGDLADLGVEINVRDYEVGSDSEHPEKQKRFLQNADLTEPFNVQNYRKWIQSNEKDTTLFHYK
eukprot:CAMPEP_0172520166 /NCGR_PEP_ID=MMETSP1066-20121228/291842_1 /TAXON_ID=671091 /ORGANISM="Coscinodiscus wailesii, Strain CCMP2513" /LENGTH=403 /DNA_ID=CAMNT_0013302877 /DNA_START=46 /DNA_END=1257 /DNA_ORIENTATION=-